MPDAITVRRARRWLLLGAIALGVAGLFAGLLSNTKSDYFYTALVVHVDLSVLVWFLTMACLFFTLAARGRGWAILADASFYSFSGGAALIALSSLTGGAPYMSNYIPVIHHPVFFLGLGLLFCGVLGVVANLLSGGKALIMDVQAYGVVSAAWILLIAVACFVRSQQSLPSDLHGQIYYEYAFWGGGHVLQFAHVQLMMVAWLWLAGSAGLSVRLKEGHITALYFVGLVSMFAAAAIYAAYPATSDEHRDSFTLLMKHANGLAPLVLGGFILHALIVPAKARTLGKSHNIEASAGMTLPKITLLMSILLFAVGGGLGYLIKGSNVVVPAHYHGSIIAITIAFMGVAYLLLPAFGWEDVSRSRLAFWQPVIYGSGQLCWMVSMAVLGEYGVPRKTPGSADTKGAVVSFFKHSADGLALIGGLLFVFVVLRAVYRKPRLQ
jgi:hypothetical protein